MTAPRSLAMIRDDVEAIGVDVARMSVDSQTPDRRLRLGRAAAYLAAAIQELAFADAAVADTPREIRA